MSISFKEFFATHPEEQKVRLGDMVDATVREINFEKKYIRVDGGLSFKSESVISMDEFLEDNHFFEEEAEAIESNDDVDTSLRSRQLEIQVGDTVPVMIESLDNGYGETILSREKAKRWLAWASLQEAMDNKTTVQGMVTGKVRGGFTVDMGALKGFLPGSLVDAQHLEEINALIQKPFDFKVITLDYQRNNIVLSQGQISREALLEKLKEGEVVKGYVKNLADYGAFINLGGIDGLLHNSDIAWEKTTAREKFKTRDPKDPIEVMILKIDKSQERPRISLGLKQLSEDPWMNLAERYSVGMRLEKRRITHIKEYGCFVEIEPGVEGLVHISEMDWTNRSPNPHTVLQKAQDEEGRIDVVILGMDVNTQENKRRLSLGIKQYTENPWETFAEQHTEGDHVKGTIRSITDLGLFIHLRGNIDGLVHHSEIKDNYSGEEAMRQFKKGDTLDVVILSIEPERERVALSIRQLDEQSITEEIEPKEQDNALEAEKDGDTDQLEQVEVIDSEEELPDLILDEAELETNDETSDLDAGAVEKEVVADEESELQDKDDVQLEKISETEVDDEGSHLEVSAEEDEHASEEAFDKPSEDTDQFEQVEVIDSEEELPDLILDEAELETNDETSDLDAGAVEKEVISEADEAFDTSDEGTDQLEQVEAIDSEEETEVEADDEISDLDSDNAEEELSPDEESDDARDKAD